MDEYKSLKARLASDVLRKKIGCGVDDVLVNYKLIQAYHASLQRTRQSTSPSSVTRPIAEPAPPPERALCSVDEVECTFCADAPNGVDVCTKCGRCEVRSEIFPKWTSFSCEHFAHLSELEHYDAFVCLGEDWLKEMAALSSEVFTRSAEFSPARVCAIFAYGKHLKATHARADSCAPRPFVLCTHCNAPLFERWQHRRHACGWEARRIVHPYGGRVRTKVYQPTAACRG